MLSKSLDRFQKKKKKQTVIYSSVPKFKADEGKKTCFSPCENPAPILAVNNHYGHKPLMSIWDLNVVQFFQMFRTSFYWE